MSQLILPESEDLPKKPKLIHVWVWGEQETLTSVERGIAFLKGHPEMILTVRVLVISSRGTEPTLNGVFVETDPTHGN